MRQNTAFQISEADRSAFRRDGVVCLRSVLDLLEVDLLRAAVARQLAALGRSPTGYDFEHLARQAWAPGAGIETGGATRFDMSGLKRMVADLSLDKAMLQDVLRKKL